MARTGVDAAKTFLTDLPKLHFWGGEERVGGLNDRIGHRLITELEQLDSPSILETGAGATTLLLLQLEPGGLTTIAPDAALQERIMAEADRQGIPTGPLRFICERSEIALPPLAEAGHRLDAALIDGNHGWPSVFVDFCYINRMLGKGGLLFVDDVHLYSVAQLHLLLRQQEDFELVSIDSKLATFRKVSNRPFLPDWRAEPFVFMNSVVL
ncbi:MAG: class I SAM-dependent methyltransferase [Acidimicrobiales bacterium]